MSLLAKNTYYPQLDSLRGISFLVIFFFHAVHPQFGSTSVGSFMGYVYSQMTLSIDIFFILSSFLLTMIGMMEHQKKGKFSFTNFFKRRLLRIWPLYFSFLLFSFLIFPFIAKAAGFEMTLPKREYYFFFVSNFYSEEHVFFLRILWTISVEEQFYLLLGILLFFFIKQLVRIFLLLLLLSFLFSLFCFFYQKDGYFHTLTYFADFAMGGLAACFITKNIRLITAIRSVKRGRIFFYCYLLFHFPLFYLLNNLFHHSLIDLLSRYVFILYITLIIIMQVQYRNETSVLKDNRFLIYTGKISYGLYCFHGISITFFQMIVRQLETNMPEWVLAILTLGFTFCVASLSYRYFEKPFLKLKDKLKMV